MTEDDRRRAFAEAFIAQARSDWTVQRLLAKQRDLPSCHGLHYLQMACEKLAKAYRVRDTASPVATLVSRHPGFAKFVAAFLGVALKDEYRGREEQLRGLIKRTRALAREIEKLAPASDRSNSPENAEYPWERDDRVIAPCRHSFPSIDLERDAGGRTLLKMIERALDGYEHLSIR